MKFRSLALLMLAEVAAMSLWFVSAAVLPDMLRETALSPFRQAALSSGVQAGFVIGALASAVLGLADRFDPRRVFAASAIGAGLINATLLIDLPGGVAAIAARVITGALLAGVYPVGMKIAVGWGEKDRGFLVGALVGALTLGSASPHLIALFGGADWRVTVAAASVASIAAGLIVLGRRTRAPSRHRGALRPARRHRGLDQPAGAARLCRLSRPHVGALCHVGLDRRGGGGLLSRVAAGARSRAARQAHRLLRHRRRRHRLRGRRASGPTGSARRKSPSSPWW